MTQQKVLVQFGAGAIGRSLVGQLFSRAGWRVVFLDVVDVVVQALNQRGGYTIKIKDDLEPGEPDSIEVTNVSAVNLADREKVVELLAGADLVGTSVGANNLPGVCDLLSQALAKRDTPISVMLCENLHNAAAMMRATIAKLLPAGYPLAERVGFVEAAISKMVPPTPLEERKADPLAVSAEAYNTLYLDAEGYIGVPPVVSGVAWRPRFQAYVDRKLLLHNFGHAAAAYNGFLVGATYIGDCMENPGVAEETALCMRETSHGLAIRHADVFTYDENRAWTDDLLRRFRNQAIQDPVYRVGRDLKRKLAPADRCIGALRLLVETGVDYTHAARAAAAGLLFRAKDESGNYYPSDEEVVKQAREQGPASILTTISGLDATRDAAVIDAVVKAYNALK